MICCQIFSPRIDQRYVGDVRSMNLIMMNIPALVKRHSADLSRLVFTSGAKLVENEVTGKYLIRSLQWLSCIMMKGEN